MNPGDFVGSTSGPPPPPTITPTDMVMTSDPQNPEPGQTTTLTITTSATQNGSKYGIKDVQVTLELTDKPDSDAKLDPATVTTDASGSATSKFTLSKRKGKHVVTATAGGLSAAFNVDTLLGSAGTPTRGRHTGAIDPMTPAPQISAFWLFALAAVIVVLSFGFPYRRGFFRRGTAILERVPIHPLRPSEALRLADVNLAGGEHWKPNARARRQARKSTDPSG